MRHVMVTTCTIQEFCLFQSSFKMVSCVSTVSRCYDRRLLQHVAVTEVAFLYQPCHCTFCRATSHPFADHFIFPMLLHCAFYVSFSTPCCSIYFFLPFSARKHADESVSMVPELYKTRGSYATLHRRSSKNEALPTPVRPIVGRLPDLT